MAVPRSHPNPDALTVDEAASYLGISRAKLAELIAGGVVPSYRLGRRRFFLRSVLDEWLHGLATGGSDSAA
jgi:excisionase family DNA binding protein